MMKALSGKRVVITGGTSGLGKSMGVKLLEQGCEVFVLGRIGHHLTGSGLKPFFCDFADLKEVVGLVDAFRDQELKIDILINNAGILSPPSYLETSDGYEISYQVNFFAHVLLTRLMQKNSVLGDGIVINMSSPIYSRGKIPIGDNSRNTTYSFLQAYADSKLLMALFSEKLAAEGVRGFSFNPGTFRSGIYRSQKDWFQHLYRIAAPFMISSEYVATRMMQIIGEDTYTSGDIISKNGKAKAVNHIDAVSKKEFWKKINQQLNRYF
jgi:NAD(P)-dependent dehydrogenase (short-subunit alcohol dehydrogenase family)